MEKIYKPALFLIPLAAIIFMSPVLVYGPGYGDLVDNIILAKNFSSQLWSGDLYPKWLVGMHNGCGSPYFYFLPPAPHYITSIFAFLGDDNLFWWQPIAAQKFLLIIIGGVFCYLWLSSFTTKEGALCGAISYIFMPYIAWVNYSSISQDYCTVSILPALLFFTNRVASAKKYSALGFASVFAIIFLFSVRNSVILGPLSLIYFIFCARKNLKNKFPVFMFSVLSGFGLAAFYILPVISQINDVELPLGFNIETDFSYKDHFMFPFGSELEIKPGSDWLGVLVIMMYLVSAILWFNIKKSKTLNIEYKKSANFWIVIIICSGFMLYPASIFLWELIPVIKMINFPMRFISIISIGLTALISIIISAPRKNAKDVDRARWTFALTLLCLQGYIFTVIVDNSLNIKFSDKEKEKQLVSLYDTMLKFSILPRSSLITKEAANNSEQLSMIADSLSICEKRAFVKEGQGDINVEKWQPGKIVIKTDSKGPFDLIITQHYFHLWRAVDEQAKEYKVLPENGSGLLKIRIEPGSHVLNIFLAKAKWEIEGAIISLISVTVIGTLRSRKTILL